MKAAQTALMALLAAVGFCPISNECRNGYFMATKQKSPA